MAKLEKWLPFKFPRRKKKAEEEPAAPRTTAVPASPAAMFQQMQRMFEPIERPWMEPFGMLGELDRFFGDYAPRTFRPSVDIIDEGKQVKVTAELPGLEKDDIELTVQDGMMMLRGEKKAEEETEEEGCYRVERYFGQFSRAVPLPPEIDTDKGEARFEKGVLTVRFPKSQQATTARRLQLR